MACGMHLAGAWAVVGGISMERYEDANFCSKEHMTSSWKRVLGLV